jgi:hypothetical protein
MLIIGFITWWAASETIFGWIIRRRATEPTLRLVAAKAHHLGRAAEEVAHSLAPDVATELASVPNRVLHEEVSDPIGIVVVVAIRTVLMFQALDSLQVIQRLNFARQLVEIHRTPPCSVYCEGYRAPSAACLYTARGRDHVFAETLNLLLEFFDLAQSVKDGHDEPVALVGETPQV